MEYKTYSHYKTHIHINKNFIIRSSVWITLQEIKVKKKEEEESWGNRTWA